MHAKGIITALLLFFSLQVLFWWKTKNITPDLVIVEEAPSASQALALSLGDKQFYFRMLALEIQNFGDTYARSTPLRNYDYRKLQRWFFLLDSLDNESNLVPAIAAYYYAGTPNKPDCIYIVEYLDQHASQNINRKWWWMAQAVMIANHNLQNPRLALKLAYKLSAARSSNIPAWVRQMPAFIHETLGEKEAAYIIMKNILNGAEKRTFSDKELNFMNGFIKQRLKINDPTIIAEP